MGFHLNHASRMIILTLLYKYLSMGATYSCYFSQEHQSVQLQLSPIGICLIKIRQNLSYKSSYALYQPTTLPCQRLVLLLVIIPECQVCHRYESTNELLNVRVCIDIIKDGRSASRNFAFSSSSSTQTLSIGLTNHYNQRLPCRQSVEPMFSIVSSEWFFHVSHATMIFLQFFLHYSLGDVSLIYFSSVIDYV